MTARVPSAEDEILFLARIQRVLSDGEFVSTYKYALLLAIADECVEQPPTTEALGIPVDRLAEHFIRAYWQQARPFDPDAARDTPSVLLQNTGRQASVLNQVAAAQASIPLLSDFEGDQKAWRSLKKKIATVVRKMPLLKLQTVAGEKLEFLYREAKVDNSIHLLPGVAHHFRKHHGLIRDLVEMAWIRFVQGLPKNAPLLRDAQELGQFLFGVERSTLQDVAPLLAERQDGKCFYCDRSIKGPVHVDHFIPWSRYPLDLGHNFVLADERCNSDKGSRLASIEHLRRWIDRNRTVEADFQTQMGRVGLPCDLRRTTAIAGWAYSLGLHSGASTWVKRRGMVRPLTKECVAVLSAALEAA